jgi:hypothetical protein
VTAAITAATSAAVATFGADLSLRHRLARLTDRLPGYIFNLPTRQ